MKKRNPKNSYLSKWVGDIFHIYDFVFQQNFYFIPAKNEEEFRKKCKKQLGKIEFKEELDNDKDGGFSVYQQNGAPVCFLWAHTPRHIIHECWHAVSWTLRKKGINLTDDSDEAFAYLLGFLTEQILKVI